MKPTLRPSRSLPLAFAFVLLVSGLALGSFLAPGLHAVTPTSAEIGLATQWADAGFAQATTNATSSVAVVEEDAADGIQWGRSWRGTPFQIGEKTYTHGLAFNATKQVRVRLNRPGARFLSDIGLENNDDTRRGAEAGNGSVAFHVLVGGKELFKSTVMRLKDTPQSIEVPLDGAREFDIRVSDGGDGRGWDQALWGEARILLQDGTTLNLQDLAQASSRASDPARLTFTFAGKPSSDFLPAWTRKLARTPMPDGGESIETTSLDPATGLELRIVAKRFNSFPAVEWVASFKNTGSTDTPVLEAVHVLDTTFGMQALNGATLHWANGGVASFDDFAPRTFSLTPGTTFSLNPAEGRSSSEALPFFNIEGDGGGIVLALGWSGRWAATFASPKAGRITVKAGMAETHLVLHPGEEIRTPSMLALFYQGNRWRGQNLLRQFILAHHRPKKDGQPLVAPITCGNWGGTPATVHLDNIAKFIQNRLPMDYYWIDAEWYGKGGWADSVGDWQVKSDLFPQGFKPLAQMLRGDKRELMLWFEPERVMRGTPWAAEHKAWMFDNGGNTLLFNLGNPDARRFVADFISDRIRDFGLGCYRQDFNMDPRGFWEKADAPDRRGMNEIRHIEGLYAFWDDLMRRDPHLILDNCASGGRRIDLETVGRATPFWRTDGPRDPIAHQCHTFGLLAWVPLSATSQDREGDTYEFRSSMCSGLCINWNHSGDGPRPPFPPDFPFDWARRTLEQYLTVRDCYYGDYYPLSAYSQATDQWMAYQLDKPEAGRGVIVALRRPESPYETAAFQVQGLDSGATYRLTNLDTNQTVEESARVLIDRGLRISIWEKPGSALVTYQKL